MRLSLTRTGAALVVAALFLVVACGGSGSGNIGAAPDAAADSSPTGTLSPTSDAGDGTDDASTTDAGACPATYAAATGSCASFEPTPSATDPVCVYPAGTCRCVDRVTCGPIVVPIEGDAATAPQWRCSAPRTDGCPEQDPDGQACADAQKTCSYPNGCCTNIATCNGGKWVTRPGACPL